MEMPLLSNRRVGVRRLLHRFIPVLVLVVVSNQALLGEKLQSRDLQVIQGTAHQKDYSDMLHNYLLREAAILTEKRLARLRGLRSEANIQNWQQDNRQKFLELIGGLPVERTSLNARVVGEILREGYVVRKVIFESLPEFYVTANLYVPTTGKAPFPAVLAPCGHSQNGKAYDVYQHLFIGLARRGYVVLAYDPLGQGERLQYWDFLSGRKSFEFNQHGMAGIQEYLLGQNLARYFIWDGIRGLDYLASLPEVNPQRLGVTGSSGGGTLATYIGMLDSRVKAASIVTFLTSIPKKIENRINDSEADPEQDIAGLLAAGIDHTEMVGMIAPRPVMIGSAVRDFFPIEGTRQTFNEVQEIYKRLGAPDQIKMVEFDHRHMYSQPLREATYAWFDRWLRGVDGEAHEPAIVTEKDETLQVTSTGQVITSLGGKTVYDFNRAAAERLQRQLEENRRRPGYRTGLAGKVEQRLDGESALTNPFSEDTNRQNMGAEKTGQTEIDGLVVEKYQLTPEPGIVVPLRVIHPRNLSSRLPAVVYLRDRSGAGDHAECFAALARLGRLVAVADVRGFGETMSARRISDAHLDYFDPRDGMDADFTFASFFLGRPLLGMRVHDARSVLSFLGMRADVDPTRIAIVGRGWAGLVALFAAAIDPQVSSVVVEGTPASFGDTAATPLYNQPVSLMLPGALQEYDLADVLGALASRPLLLLNPQDAMTKKIVKAEVDNFVEPIRKSYNLAGAERAFEVEVVPLDSDIQEKIVKWISAH